MRMYIYVHRMKELKRKANSKSSADYHAINIIQFDPFRTLFGTRFSKRVVRRMFIRTVTRMHTKLCECEVLKKKRTEMS